MEETPPSDNQNKEIMDALKQFEAGKTVQELERPEPSVASLSSMPETSKVVMLAMRVFGLKEERQAEYVILLLVVIAFSVSLYLFFGTGPSQSTTIPQVFPNQSQFVPNQ